MDLRTHHQVLKGLSRAYRLKEPREERKRVSVSLKLKEYLHKGKGNQATRLGLRKASHKGAQKTQAIVL